MMELVNIHSIYRHHTIELPFVQSLSDTAGERQFV